MNLETGRLSVHSTGMYVWDIIVPAIVLWYHYHVVDGGRRDL